MSAVALPRARPRWPRGNRVLLFLAVGNAACTVYELVVGEFVWVAFNGPITVFLWRAYIRSRDDDSGHGPRLT